MKTITMLAVLCSCAVALAKGDAPTAPPLPPEVAKTVAAFAGKWTMDTTMTMPGAKEPMKVKEKMDCKKVSGGRAALCIESGMITGMGPIDFTHMIAYDPERKQVHWFAVGNSGEVHDHPCTWKDDKTLACEPLKATLNGGPITEDFSVTIDGNKMSIKGSQTSKDGAMTFDVSAKRAGG
jgi:hypothetical protein